MKKYTVQNIIRTAVSAFFQFAVFGIFIALQRMFWPSLTAYYPKPGGILAALMAEIAGLCAVVCAVIVLCVVKHVRQGRVPEILDLPARNITVTLLTLICGSALSIYLYSSEMYSLTVSKVISEAVLLIFSVFVYLVYEYRSAVIQKFPRSFRGFMGKFVISKRPTLRRFPPFIRSLVYSAGVTAVAVTPLMGFMVLENLHFTDFDGLFNFFQNHIANAAFAVFVLYSLYSVVLLVCKKGWITSLIFTLACDAVAITNYFKYALTDDYFYPWDLVSQTGNLGELLGFVKIGLPPKCVFFIAVSLLLPVIAYISKFTIRVRWPWRITLAASLAFSMMMTVATPDRVTKFLNSHGVYIEATALQESNFRENGYTGGFIINVLSSNVAKPENYSQTTIEGIMESYEGKSADDGFSSPDVILILSESFWDPEGLPGTTFSKDPTPNFDSITARENCVSGRLYQTAFGGGTVRPEFEILTGLTTDYLPSGAVPWQYVTETTPSFVSIYKELGYHTTALHPYLSSFYLRDNSYPLIGFDDLLFSEELTAIEEVEYAYSGGQISDDSFVSYIEYLLEKDEEADIPSFIFGISMENHQPYENKFAKTEITVENPAFSESTLNAVTNFTQGVYEADAALGRLVDYIDSRERDTVLIYYGDHLPTLGASRAAYVESGMITTGASAEERALLQSTPFLVYSNFEMKKSEVLKEGSDNHISSYHLMMGAGDLIGAPTTDYIEYLRDYFEAQPYYNVRLNMALSEEGAYFADAHRCLTYDILCGERYSLK